MSAQIKRIRLGDLLVEHKLISEGQLIAALDEQKKSGHKLGRVLVENGYVKENDVLNLLSRQLNVPFVDLSIFQFKPDIVNKIPETAARRFRALALEERWHWKTHRTVYWLAWLTRPIFLLTMTWSGWRKAQLKLL